MTDVMTGADNAAVEWTKCAHCRARWPSDGIETHTAECEGFSLRARLAEQEAALRDVISGAIETGSADHCAHIARAAIASRGAAHG